MKAHKLLCLKFTTLPTKFSKEIMKDRLTLTEIAKYWSQTWIMTDTEYQAETWYESQVNCAELWDQKIFCFYEPCYVCFLAIQSSHFFRNQTSYLVYCTVYQICTWRRFCALSCDGLPTSRTSCTDLIGESRICCCLRNLLPFG